MKRILLLVFIVSFSAYSQTFRVGDDSYKVQILLEGRYGHQNKYDSYGNKKDIAKYEKIYSNGKITEIRVKDYNKYITDLQVKSNIITRFFFEEGRLKKIIKQFENLSLNSLKMRYVKAYNQYKIGKYYFTKDYKDCSQIKLIDNLASIVYLERSQVAFSKEELGVIEKRRAVYLRDFEKSKNNRSLVRELQNKRFEIGDYDKVFLDTIIPQITSTVISLTQQNLKLSLAVNSVHARNTFQQLNDTSKFYFFSGDRDKTECFLSMGSVKGYSLKYMQRPLRKAILLPEIKKEIGGSEYSLNTEFTIEYTFKLTRKKAIINYKKNKPIKLNKKYNFSENEESIIESYFKNKDSGRYQIMCQFGTVNNIKADKIHAIELNSSLSALLEGNQIKNK